MLVTKEMFVVWCPGSGDYDVEAELLGLFVKESDAQECADIYNIPFNAAGGWRQGRGKAFVSKQIVQY